MAPASMMRLQSANTGMNRLWKFTPRRTPAASQAAIMRSASTAHVASGLSQKTCLPARAAAMACSA